MVRVVVDNRVRIDSRDITAEDAGAIVAAFTHDNPAFEKRRRMNLPTWPEPRQYKTFEWRGDELSVPRGGMSRVRAILRARGHAIAPVDMRTAGTPLAELVKPGQVARIPEHRLTLRDYQDEALAVLLERQNCLLRAPTGCGKTSVGFAVAAAANLATLVVVWSGALFDQWVKRAEAELGLRGRDVGVVRAGTRRLRPLTIAMQQTLARLMEANGPEAEEVRSFPGLVICDEVQRFAAPTLFACVDPFAARYRIGISADHSRKDRKEFLIEDLFGDVGHEIDRRDLVDAGHVLEVEVRVVPTTTEVPRSDDYNALLDALALDDARNDLVEHIAAEEHAAGHQVVAISRRRDHCVELDARMSRLGIRSGLMLGGDADAARYEQTLGGLLDGSLRAAAATEQAFGTGIDVPSLSVGILATPLATNRQQFGQVKGRFCRPGKSEARLYYLWDRYVFGVAHLENIIRWNARVLVRAHDGEWVPGRDYVRALKNPAA